MSPTGATRPLRVYFPCSGLGREARGFETFTREASDALAGDPRFEITVFAGAPTPGRHDVVLPSFNRHGRAATWIGNRIDASAYFVEQASFFFSLLPRLVAGRPDLIYFADINVGNACWHWRRLSRQRYRLLFYNGGATTRPYTRADLVQHLVTVHYEEALARGEPADRNVVLPHGVEIARELFAPSQSASRRELGLPLDRRIVLTVGLLDAHTKNLPYVLRELAAISKPRPLLVMLGAATAETPAILNLATELLGADGFQWHTVRHPDMPRWYNAADVFVLASLREGFGLAYVEALSHGLPVLAHDYPVPRELLGDLGCYGDFRIPGVLKRLLASTLAGETDELMRARRHRVAWDRFSWERLREPYAELLQRAAAMPLR